MNVFSPDTSAFASYEEKGKYTMAWRFSLFFTIIFAFLTAVMYTYSFEVGVLYTIISLISSSTFLFLAMTKRYVPIFWVYVIAGSVISQYALHYIHDTIHFSDFLWVVLAIVFTFVSIGRKAGWVVLTLNLLGIIVFFMYSINAHLQVIHQQSSRDTISLVVEIILAFLILAYLLNQFVDFQTYSKTKLTDLNSNLEHQNEMILIQNKENTTLVKEIHHRVKNNLQIIISLLRMQRGELKSDEAKEQFTVAINRILTMSMIHQKLYQEKTPSKISIKDYTKDLSAELLSLEGPDTKIKVEINASDEFAGLKTIVPFGLLLNELISNSIKHAFGEVKQGEIAISLSAEDNEINFQYMDSGKWTEPEEGTEGFGLELIDILTEQLEGTYKRSGSKYEFQFSIES